MTKTRSILAGLAALAALALGCSSGGGDEAVNNDQGAAAPAAQGAQEPAAEATTQAAAAPKPADFKLTVKEKSKECFGSAGCNVTWEVDVAVDPAKLGGQGWAVTYEVKGVQDGPQVQTVSIAEDGTFASYEAKGFGQTPKRSTKLTAKATRVEAN